MDQITFFISIYLFLFSKSGPGAEANIFSLACSNLVGQMADPDFFTNILKNERNFGLGWAGLAGVGVARSPDLASC